MSLPATCQQMDKWGRDGAFFYTIQCIRNGEPREWTIEARNDEDASNQIGNILAEDLDNGYPPGQTPDGRPNYGRSFSGGGGCVPGDCKVLMADGSAKPIATISEGDVVLARKFGSLEISEREVVGNWLDRTDALIGLMTPSGTLFWTSEDQSIITVGGPVKAAHIFNGASVRKLSSEKNVNGVYRMDGKNKEIQRAPVDVFSLDLGGEYSFFAGDDQIEIACGVIIGIGGPIQKY